MPVQVVHRLMDHALVTRDRPRGYDDPVALEHVDEWVTLGGESSQGRHRLPLAAGGEKQQLRRRHSIDVLELDCESVWHLEEPKLARGLEVGLQASPDHGDLALDLSRHPDQVLAPVAVGSEARDHDAAGSFAEYALKRRMEIALRAGVPCALGIGGVAEQQQNALV